MARSRHSLLCIAALLLGAGGLRGHEEWNNLHITFNSKDTFIYPFDGRSPKVGAALLNHHEFTSLEVKLALNINGQPAGSGFTTFPDGGNIVVTPDDYGIASTPSGGVYDGRVGPAPAAGETKTVTFDFVFSPVDPAAAEPDEEPTYTQTQVVRFINAGDNPVLTGTFGVSGTLRFPTIVGSPVAANVVVEVATPVSPWLRVATTGVPTGAGPAVSFSTPLPARNDWHIRFSADGYETVVVPLGLFSDPRQPFDLVLVPAASPDFDYRRIAAIATPTGFWRGAVSESEGTFAAFPGQENWKSVATDADARALRTAGRVYKYKFDGTKLWEHAPGWEIWGGDMTPDGRFVAYALNPTRTSFYTPTENKLVLLDGATGAVLWTKSGAVQDATVGRKLESLEVVFSPDAKWIAVGSTASGQLTLVDRATGNFAWSAPTSGPSFGQVRKLRFSADSQFLFCGSGDSYLRKLRVGDGAVLWRTFVGGWPFVNGLDLSADGAWITTGTKSLDTALIRASDGRQMWMTETQVLDAVFSPDGRHVATFGGHVFRVADGSLAGMVKTPSVSRFTPDGRWLLKFDRRLILYDLGGKQLRDFGDSTIGAGNGEQSQWAHLSRDGRYAIILGRDMANPPQTGIAIFERQAAAASSAPVIAAHPLPQAIAVGAPATLVVTASPASAGLAYQWKKNGADLVGQNSAALTLAAASASDAGNYTCVVTNAAGSTTSATAALAVVSPVVANPPRLTNLAVRANAGPGAQTLIVGFVLGGAGTGGNKSLLLRGAGPALVPFGVLGALRDPKLAFFRGGALLATNDNWSGDASVAALTAQVGAFPFASNASADAALSALPDPGSYTVQITSADLTSGIALAEIYDASTAFGATVPRLINLSARTDAGGTNGTLIAGFVVAGSAARNVLIRAVGPGLAQFGVTGVLADPQLALFRDGTQVAVNDNWYDAPNAVAIATAAANIGAFALPITSRDSALLLSLPPGSYTAQVTASTGSGQGGASGNVLVEVYEVP